MLCERVRRGSTNMGDRGISCVNHTGVVTIMESETPKLHSLSDLERQHGIRRGLLSQWLWRGDIDRSDCLTIAGRTLMSDDYEGAPCYGQAIGTINVAP